MVRAKQGALILLLVLIMAVPFSGSLASADVAIQPWDIVCKTPPVITVNSPSNSTILYGNSIPLNMTFTQPTGQWVIRYVDPHGNLIKQMLTDFGYVLDGVSSGSVPASSDLSYPFKFYSDLTINGSGLHSLQVFANASGYVISLGVPQYVPISRISNTIYFETFPQYPTIVVQSVIVNGTSANLNFTVDEPFSKLTYNIDNQANATITGNTTLTDLPYGTHNLTIFTTNLAGNLGFETVVFTIPTSTSGSPYRFLTSIIIIAIIFAIITAITVLAIFRRHRKQSNILQVLERT
jgi:hypothetical protein